MPDLPPVEFARVIGRFVAAIADGPDIDDTPDFVPLTGNVTFSPRVSALKVPSAVPDPTTVLPAPVTVQLDQFGYLTWRGKRGVYLVAPTAVVNPSAWNYTVSFDLRLDDISVPYLPFSFDAPVYVPGPDEEDPDEGSTAIDLTLVAPVPSSTGVPTTIGPYPTSVAVVGDALVFTMSDLSTLPPVSIDAINDLDDAVVAAEGFADDAEDAQVAAEAAQAAAEAAAAAAVSMVVPVGGVDATNKIVDGVVTEAKLDAAAQAKLNGGVPSTRTLTAGTGLTGGGNLTADRTFAVSYGTSAGTAAQGNDSRITSAVPNTRTVSAGTGLTGGGDLSANRTLTVAYGTSSSTACVGNDSRLSDTRTPSAATVPCDFVWVAQSGTRATGIGDLAVGQYVGRAFTVTKVIYQFDTADASGNTSVELRRNGTQVTSSNLTISAANQADGTSTDAARTATISQSYAVGDRLAVQCTAIGTTPGKGLRAYIFGTWN